MKWGRDKLHKVDDDNEEDDNGSTTSMNIHIDRSFIAKQSNSSLLYVPPPELSTSQAYLAKGPMPIIIDSSTTSHIHNERLDFTFLDKDDTNNIMGFGDGDPLPLLEVLELCKMAYGSLNKLTRCPHPIANV